MRLSASARPPAGRWAWQSKRVINWLNGSTLLGLGVARAGRAAVSGGPRGLLLASGYRFRFPAAGAFTVGNVVITSSQTWSGLVVDRPLLLEHEERHSWQYVLFGGLPFLPAYLVFAAWSQLRAGNPGALNPFEQRAGLLAGGYQT